MKSPKKKSSKAKVKVKKFKNLNAGFALTFIVLAFVITAGAAISGAYFRDDYELAVGEVSPRNFRAPWDFQNDVATEKAREDARNLVQPRYAVDQTVNDEIISGLDEFFNEINALRDAYTPISGQGGTAAAPDLSSAEIKIPLSSDSLNYLVHTSTMSTGDYLNFKSEVYTIVQSYLDKKISGDDGLAKAVSNATEDVNKEIWDAAVKSAAVDIISYSLQINDFIDEATTQKLRDDAAAAVTPVLYKKDQTIVSAGEIISAEAYAALDKLGYVKRGVFDNVYRLSGALVISIISFSLGLIYIYFFNRQITQNKRTVVLYFTLYALGIILVSALSFAPFPFLPILLICMLTALLADARAALMMTICLTVSAAVITNADFKFVIYFIITGTFISLMGKFTTERNKVFSVGIAVSLFSAVAAGASYFFFDGAYSTAMRTSAVYAALAGVLTVIICIGSLPLWESAFGVITNIKLLELTNPNNELLRRLTIEAPSTYHHSLLVANLAETGAYDIGANSMLARIGGYYHDIGKLKYPQFFGENVNGQNPHEMLDPFTSAQIVIGHVTEGLTLAEQNKLPKQIVAFIAEHHGDTLIKFFYAKAKTQFPDFEIDEKKFRYPYPRPGSRETAVVMLADTVEAAVRSQIQQDRSMRSIESLVRSLIKDKLDDDQLINSDLTINNLETLVKSFMRVFTGMYHERIPYPAGSTKELIGKPVEEAEKPEAPDGPAGEDMADEKGTAPAPEA